jgi:hypothetical protein
MAKFKFAFDTAQFSGYSDVVEAETQKLAVKRFVAGFKKVGKANPDILKIEEMSTETGSKGIPDWKTVWVKSKLAGNLSSASK